MNIYRKNEIPNHLLEHFVPAEIGLEPTPDDFVAAMLEVFGGKDNPVGVWRVLRDDGVLWLNLGDSYASSGASSGFTTQNVPTINGQKNSRRAGGAADCKPKDMIGIPWRVAFALQAAGWYLRDAVIWHKPAPMPGSQRDRCTSSYEFIFQLTKNARYFFDMEAVKEASDPASMSRLAQDVAEQAGSERANGGEKTNGTMKAVGGATRTPRNVWKIAHEGFSDWSEIVRVHPVPSGDEVSDDTMRITSSDCPLHAGHLDRVPKAFRGGRADDELIRIFDTHDRHAPTHASGSDLSDWLREHCSVADSLDCPVPMCSGSARGRSKKSHKTGRDPSTSPACIASAQSHPHIGGRSGKPSLCGLAEHKTASSTSESSALSGMATDPLGQNEPHNDCNGSCSCAHYSITTEKISHFATFPRELPTRCIKASTSEKGCCPACGAAMVRVVERGQYKPPTVDPGGRNVDESRGDKTRKLSGKEYNEQATARTTGWEMGCNCHPDPDGAALIIHKNSVPCRVLDPFNGAGTTGIAANLLGHDYTGCELNPEYAAMAINRIARELRPQTAVNNNAEPIGLFK